MARRRRATGLRRPAVQHRPHADTPHVWSRPARPSTATARGSAAAATRRSCSPSPPIATSSTTTSASSRPALRRCGASCTPTGTLYLHLDYREAHYAKLLLDEIYGRECFLNELIWAYDYGAKPKGRWPQKHDTILVYVKDPSAYYSTRRRSTASRHARPGDAGAAERAGKRPMSVMWHTIVSPTGREKTGYPTQKPEGLVRRFVQASSRAGDLCLDPFAGSGTLGAVAPKLGRRYLLIDQSPEAVGSWRRDLFDGRRVRPRPREPDRRAHRLQRRARAALRDRAGVTVTADVARPLDRRRARPRRAGRVRPRPARARGLARVRARHGGRAAPAGSTSRPRGLTIAATCRRARPLVLRGA